MTPRDRRLTTGLQIVTTVVVLILLIYSVVTSQNIADRRQAEALEAAERNRELIAGVRGLVLDTRDLVANVELQQRDQRRAFNQLARRNEQLHNSDPDNAPVFGHSGASNPPTSSRPAPRASGDEPSPQPSPRRDPPAQQPPSQPEPRPQPSPRPQPPAPTPAPSAPPPGDCSVRRPSGYRCRSDPGSTRADLMNASTSVRCSRRTRPIL